MRGCGAVAFLACAQGQGEGRAAGRGKRRGRGGTDAGKPHAGRRSVGRGRMHTGRGCRPGAHVVQGSRERRGVMQGGARWVLPVSGKHVRWVMVEGSVARLDKWGRAQREGKACMCMCVCARARKVWRSGGLTEVGAWTRMAAMQRDVALSKLGGYVRCRRLVQGGGGDPGGQPASGVGCGWLGACMVAGRVLGAFRASGTTRVFGGRRRLVRSGWRRVFYRLHGGRGRCAASGAALGRHRLSLWQAVAGCVSGC